MNDIIFYEAFEEEQLTIKKMLPDSMNALYTADSVQEKNEIDPPARIISIRTQSRIPEQWFSHIDGVLTRSQGYDHLVSMFRGNEDQVALGYLGSYCARSVAEHALMTMLVLQKNLKQQIEQFKTFNRDGLTGIECMGRRALTIGVGHIGSVIVDLTKALGMQVKGVDIAPKKLDVEYVSLQEGIRWADVIFCALPLTDLTHGLLDYRLLSANENRAILINVSRGEISPINDLAKLLDEKIMGGVSLDVYENEQSIAHQLRANRATDTAAEQVLLLSQRPDVLFTPHNAFNTREAVDAKVKHTVESVSYFIRNGKFPFPVEVE